MWRYYADRIVITIMFNWKVQNGFESLSNTFHWGDCCGMILTEKDFISINVMHGSPSRSQTNLKKVHKQPVNVKVSLVLTELKAIHAQWIVDLYQY